MMYNDMPVIIPLLATGYLLTIYILLMLAQRTIKSSRYVANSLTDAYASYMPTEQAYKKDEVERWSRSVSSATPTSKRDAVASKELPSELRCTIAVAHLSDAQGNGVASASGVASLTMRTAPPQKIQQASRAR